MIELQGRLPQIINELNFKIYNINFSSAVDLGGLIVRLNEVSEDSHVALGKGRMHLRKNKETIEAEAFQVTMKTQENLQTLYDYFSGMASILAIKYSYFSQILDFKKFR